MQTWAHGVTAADAVYEIEGRRWRPDEGGFADAVVLAHERRLRPRCLCQPQGVEMYVARLAGPLGGYIVKRMPETGHLHRMDCPSYEPPPDASGLGQLLGTAIVEDPATGLTTLKLDFPLTRMPGRSAPPPVAAHRGDSARSPGTKLSLRALLHYLWDQAGLTRWHLGFAGKRHWGTVRRHLLQAAAQMMARGEPLAQRLYIPEVFSVEQREAIHARRMAQWALATQAAQPPGQPQPLMLLVGEVKEIVPARYGHKAVIKHVPDQGFAIDAALFRRLGRRFEAELALWGASDALHMIVIALFEFGRIEVPAIQELSLMTVTPEWIPVEDGYEAKLLGKLVDERRTFKKALRYDHQAAADTVCVTLDLGDGAATPLHLARTGSPRDALPDEPLSEVEGWIWRPPEPQPPFPAQRGCRTAG